VEITDRIGLTAKSTKFKPVSNPFKNTKCKTTGGNDKTTGCFSTSLWKQLFFKWIQVKTLWINAMSGDYKFKLPKRHPETHHQSLQAIHRDLETSKPMFNKKR